MVDKMTCPGCGAHTSTVLARVREGEPCPNCGLSAEAIIEVTQVRQRAADEELKGRLSTALIERDRAVTEAARLRAAAESARDALDRALKGEGGDPDQF